MKAPVQPNERQQFLEKTDPFDGHVITIQVMTVSDVSAANHHTVGAPAKCIENKLRIDPAAAHNSD